MAAILAIVLEILGLVSTITAAVNSILGVVSTTAQETSPRIIQTIASNAANTVNSPTHGNAALLDAMDSLEANLASDYTAILAAIASAQQTGSPVTLPSTPPTGYGGDVTVAAADVWAYPSAITGQNANDRLDNAYLVALNFSDMSARVPIQGNRYIDAFGTWVSAYGVNSAGSQPLFPVANILGTDTLLVFLARESLYAGWAYNADGYAYVSQGGVGNPFGYITTINATEFIALRDGPTPAGNVLLPPVWPGLDRVILGDPVLIEPQLTITGPMDGVLVLITVSSINKPFLAYDGQGAYKFIGGLSFVTDNGDVEPFQQLGFLHAVYCPLQMARAAECVIRADAGLIGTVTPWVIAT